MKEQIEIGVNAKTGDKVHFNVMRLILTRLLICANSGGGKSWLIRRLAELLCKIMPVVIFDWEGEFSSLREKFDFLIIGNGGDAPADCRSAKKLMLMILENQTSAVIDLSELDSREKHLYVKLACEAAISAPKHLWRETAFIFDESHEVAPENGKGYSEAKGAVLAIANKGRKRRFLSIFATQRVHKLALDIRAEMLNRMIGMTFEPDDLEVAAKIAGIHGKDQIAEFRKTMREMGEGNFFTFGRAVSVETILVKVGNVQTMHEAQAAKYGLKSPPPTDKIRKLLPQLADLPQQAAQEEKTLADANARIKELNDELRKARLMVPDAPKPQAPRIVEVPIISKGDMAKINQTGKTLASFESRLTKILDVAKTMQENLKSVVIIPPQNLTLPQREAVNPTRLNEPASQPVRLPVSPTLFRGAQVPNVGQDFEPNKCERAILSVLAQFPDGCGMSKIALLARYSISGGFRNSLSSLRKSQAIQGENSATMTITAHGKRMLGAFDPLPSGPALIQFWKAHPAFGACTKAIIDVLAECPSQAGYGMEEIAKRCQPPYEISGGFRNSLSQLRTAGVIIGKNSELMRLNPEMFS